MNGSLKKLTAITIILLFISTSVISTSSGILILSEEQNRSFNDLLFNLKISFFMKGAHIPYLSACIIKNDSVVWSKGYGFYKKLFPRYSSSNTIYPVASVSKMITATALMQLYEDEIFDLDDDVNDYLDFSLRNPNFPDVPITFRMLLAHQSSLRDYEYTIDFVYADFNYSFVKEFLTAEGSYYNPEYWGNYPPGGEANYSNIAFTVLGYLLEKLSNKSLEEYCQENIFQPLGMNDTSFDMNALDNKRLGTPYRRLARRNIPVPHFDLEFCDPCGGLLTTTDDISRLLIAHMNNGTYGDVRILDNLTVELMHSVQYPESSKWFNYRFGLGWLLTLDEAGEVRFEGHNGDLNFFHARMKIQTSEDTAVILLFCWDTTPRVLFKNLNSLYIAFGRILVNKVIDLLFQKADNY
jgi:CubicO group peptidase (beta-lactamase class C family)